MKGGEAVSLHTVELDQYQYQYLLYFHFKSL